MRFIFILGMFVVVVFLFFNLVSWLESFLKARKQDELNQNLIVSEIKQIHELMFNQTEESIKESLESIKNRIDNLGGMNDTLFQYLSKTAQIFKEQETIIKTLSDFNDSDLHDIKSYTQEYRNDFSRFVETLLLSEKLNHQDSLQLALKYFNVAEQEKARLENIRNKNSRDLTESFNQSLSDLEMVRNAHRQLTNNLPDLHR